jgi:hypothetical protein
MNITTQTAQMYAKKYALVIGFVVLILLIAIPYMLGYRIGPGVKIERVGTLDLANIPAGSSIIIDQNFTRTTKAPGDASYELLTGSHSIIVSAPGDFPWNALVPITSGKNTVVTPILISEHPNITLLSGSDQTTAQQTIASSTLPSKTNPLVLADGCANVYVSNNQIIAEAQNAPGCTPPAFLCDTLTSCSPTVIFSPLSSLGGVARFPGRQDALVIEFDNVLYAIDLDPRTPQYFAPILGATSPKMGTLPDGTIVVQNGTAVFRINL